MHIRTGTAETKPTLKQSIHMPCRPHLWNLSEITLDIPGEGSVF